MFAKTDAHTPNTHKSFFLKEYSFAFIIGGAVEGRVLHKRSTLLFSLPDHRSPGRNAKERTRAGGSQEEAGPDPPAAV